MLLDIYVVLFEGKSVGFGIEAGVTLILFWLPFFIYLHSQEIAFSDEIVSYTSWYSWRRIIRIKNIEKWSLKIGIAEQRSRPFVRLEIHPIDKTQDDTIVIGLKLYAQSDLKCLFAVLPKDKERE